MPSPRLLISLFAALLLGSGCINLPEVDSPQGDAGVPPSSADSGNNPPDGGDTPDASTPTTLTVNMLAPSETVFTNDLVDVQVQVTGGTPDSVELLVNGQRLTALASPYTYQWSTRLVAEGTHQLVARATLGDKRFTSEVREVVVDRTPPQVASRTPTPGAQDVWVRLPIEATFSEPLKASTLKGDSVRLTVGTTDVAATVSLSTDGRKLTVTPSSRILVPNTAKLTLSAALTDMAGNALSLPSDTWIWSLPTVFPMGTLNALTGSTPADNPILQFDSSGNPVVTWLEAPATDAGMRDVHTSIWNGSSWQELGPKTNSLSFTQSLTLPQLAMRIDSTGRPVVAWIQLQDMNKGQIIVRRWSGAEWQTLGAPLGTIPTEYAARPYSVSLQINKKDYPVVAWEQHDQLDSASRILIMQWNGSTWESAGTPIPISKTNGRAYPSLAIDSTNNPVIAWADFAANGINGIQVYRWTDTGWQALGLRIEAIPEPSTPADNPNLLLDAEGAPIVAWSEYDGATRNIYVRRWKDNSWESLDGALSALPANSSAVLPSLQLDAAENLFVMWTEADEAGGSRGYLRRWAGSAWEEIGAPFNKALDRHWSLALDALGSPVITYLNSESTGVTTIGISRYNH